jgi:hypothetical protein
MKEDEIGRTCSTYEIDKCEFSLRIQKGRDHWEDLGVDERIKLKCILRK